MPVGIAEFFTEFAAKGKDQHTEQQQERKHFIE
jgi:hypothetical protein